MLWAWIPWLSGHRNSPQAEDPHTVDDEQHINVGGQRVHIDDVTEELAAQMSPDEQRVYATKLQQFYA